MDGKADREIRCWTQANRETRRPKCGEGSGPEAFGGVVCMKQTHVQISLLRNVHPGKWFRHPDRNLGRTVCRRSSSRNLNAGCKCERCDGSTKPDSVTVSLFRDRNEAYRLRVLGAAAGVLAVALVLVWAWPQSIDSPSDLPFRDAPTEVVRLQEITPTSQSQKLAPPPPAPLPPIVVAEDVLVEVDFDGTGPLQIEDPDDDARLQEGTDRPTEAQTTRRGARLLRAVQPRYPESARSDEVRARVVVEVGVDDTGRVTDVAILQRLLATASGMEDVERLRYGLEESALDAARRSIFRPAETNGRAVATRTTLTFTFGDGADQESR